MGAGISSCAKKVEGPDTNRTIVYLCTIALLSYEREYKLKIILLTTL